MDLSKLDFAPGRAFNKKIWDSISSSVGYEGSPCSNEFFLLISFSRSRFRFSEENVGLCLQSVLGGNPSSFAPSCVEKRVFRFAVSSKQVGLLVLRLSVVDSLAFKLAFFLCNDRGLSDATAFSLRNSGPSFDWVEVGSRTDQKPHMLIYRVLIVSLLARALDRLVLRGIPPILAMNVICIAQELQEVTILGSRWSLNVPRFFLGCLLIRPLFLEQIDMLPGILLQLQDRFSKDLGLKESQCLIVLFGNKKIGQGCDLFKFEFCCSCKPKVRVAQHCRQGTSEMQKVLISQPP